MGDLLFSQHTYIHRVHIPYDLFIAGLLPGILLSSVFMLIIYIWVRLRPQMRTGGDNLSWRMILTSGRRVWPVVLLLVLVMGGIWAGVLTPTEAGGIGAFFALMITLVRRGFIKKELIESIRTTP